MIINDLRPLHFYMILKINVSDYLNDYRIKTSFCKLEVKWLMV